jgi:hypothetical protein
VQVDAIEQGSGETRPVARHLLLGATAAAPRIAEIATGTRIHRGDELEPRRKDGLPRRPRNMDFAVLEGLAQYLQDAAIEFRQLIQKQYAAVRE